MFSIRAVFPAYFSETYSAETPTASMVKLAPVAREAEQDGYDCLYDPGSIETEVLERLHHAMPEHGVGFCTVNGLALVTQEFPDKRIFVLDCEEH